MQNDHIEEPKMSLGYVKGQYWVADARYQKWADTETYSRLIAACRDAGFMFGVEYSYSAKQYVAEIVTYERIAEGRSRRLLHGNAYNEHPMTAITTAIRGHDFTHPLVVVLCAELDIMVMREKLLRFGPAEDALEALADTIVLGMRL